MATEVAALPQPEGVGRLIRYVRTMMAEIGQDELADRASRTGVRISRNMIHRFETGKQRPELGQLVAIAKALGVTVYNLGAQEALYPEMGLLIDQGWEPVAPMGDPRQNVCSGARPRHLRVLPSIFAPSLEP